MSDNEKMDRRKYHRLPIELHLEVDELFKQDNIIMKEFNDSVLVFDISKSGLGFICEESLPLGYYFRGRINLGDNDFIDVVIKIVRAHITKDDRMIYGAEFIGLAPFLADKVDQYEQRLNKNR